MSPQATGKPAVRWRGFTTLGIAAIALTLMAGAAHAATGGTPGPNQGPFNPAADSEANHCFVSFAGTWLDLNEVTGRSEAFVETNYCPEVEAGEFWISGCTWTTNTVHANYPSGYAPTGDTPLEDFLAKLKAIKLVVDPGTRQEHIYVYRDVQALLNLESWSTLTSAPSPWGKDVPVMAFLPQAPPEPVGRHTVQTFVVMGADHWDGLGNDPELNFLPAGETLYTTRHFTTIRGSS